MDLDARVDRERYPAADSRASSGPSGASGSSEGIVSRVFSQLFYQFSQCISERSMFDTWGIGMSKYERGEKGVQGPMSQVRWFGDLCFSIHPPSPRSTTEDTRYIRSPKVPRDAVRWIHLVAAGRRPGGAIRSKRLTLKPKTAGNHEDRSNNWQSQVHIKNEVRDESHLF